MTAVYACLATYEVWHGASNSMKGTLLCIPLVILFGKLSTVYPKKPQYEYSIAIYPVGDRCW